MTTGHLEHCRNTTSCINTRMKSSRISERNVAKVAWSHLGMALTEEFVQILMEFSVEHKVSMVLIWILWDSPV
jgi:hypothetical protein